MSTLVLGPAERADVAVDFSLPTGTQITMTNSAPAPFPTGDPTEADLDMMNEIQGELDAFNLDVKEGRA